MGQLYIPGEKEINGPWFIGSSELEELDQVLNYVEEKILESAEIELNETAKIAVERGDYENLETARSKIKGYRFGSDDKVKKVVLISSNGKRLTDSSIEGIPR